MSSAPRSHIAKWVAAATMIACILAAGAVVISSRPAGRETTTDQMAVVSSSGSACNFPEFFPDRLPWTDHVEQPDEMTKGNDGSAQLRWVAPRPLPSEMAPTEVALVRRPRPSSFGPEAASGIARGHAVRAVLVGDEGVGSVRMFWREADGDCESYELNIDRGIGLEDALRLLPR